MDMGNFGQMAGMGGLATGLMGLFGGGNDPYKQAGQTLGQIPGAVAPYYQPYQQAGIHALNQYGNQNDKLLGNLPGIQGQFSQMMNDPGGFYNKIAGGYHQSPGYQWQLGQGMNAANNAAAAGGMLGSPMHQQQASTMAEGLANQDFQNYLNQVMGVQSRGLGGATGLYGMGHQGTSDMAHMGYGANDQMAKIISDMMSGQAQMQFNGQASQNQAQGQNWGNILGSLAMFM